MKRPAPPRAKQIATQRTYHGDTVIDEYAWLQQRDNPDTIAYLRAEADHTATATAHLASLRDLLLDEFRSRTPPAELTVPVLKDGYWYYNRTEAGRPYILHCRVPASEGATAPPELGGAAGAGGPLPGEELLLDRNILAGDSPYFNLGIFDVSPDGRLLAHGVDHIGDERFTLQIKDLCSGTLRPDRMPDVSSGSAWSADGTRLFYVTADDTGRPYRVWRHTIGSSAGDRLVHEEPDRQFRLGVALSRSRGFIVITSRSRTTSEVHVIAADRADGPPVVIAPRRPGVDYTVDHQGDRFLVLHNAGAPDFALAWTPAAAPGAWHSLVEHVAGVRLTQVYAFARHTVLALRRNGLTGLRVLSPDGTGIRDVVFPEPIHTVRPDRNLEYATTLFRIRYASLVTPESVYDCDLGSGELLLRRRTGVGGGFRPEHYEQHREWATAPDGVRVPVSILARRGAPRTGGVLYAYGAYQVPADPWFSPTLLSLVDRGVVFAVAHPRGGGELGRSWWDGGRLLAKKNTFTDFLAAAEHLTDAGWVASGRLVARGASAGGLLVGAVANLAPDRFAGIVAEVPFVDPLTTMLDPDRPLTVQDRDEWGDPVADPDVYAYLKSYAPYDNVGEHRYPPILATAGLHDTRVACHEPAKWVARIRSLSPATAVLLRTEMHGGHSGPSGRERSWRAEAFITSWILDRLAAPATRPTSPSSEPAPADRQPG